MELFFDNIVFEEDNEKLKLRLFNFYSLELNKELIRFNKLIDKHTIDVQKPKQFELILEGLLDKKLINTIQQKPAIYIRKNFLPLVGHVAFGIIDRGTEIVEIRPITGCNLDCIFCSVTQAKRQRTFVVDPDYLLEEFKKVYDYKKSFDPNCDIKAHINCQGEILLYSPLKKLIKGLNHMGVKEIAIYTNGTILTKNIIDDLVNSGLTRIHITLNSLNEKKAAELSGKSWYNLKKILKCLDYAKDKLTIVIAPVWMQGINDIDIEELIEYSIKNNFLIGIQNFLNYKHGKNPIKQIPFPLFYKKLNRLEEKYKINLIWNRPKETKKLEKPFKKNDIIEGEYVCDGFFNNERLYKDINNQRVIAVFSNKIKKHCKIKIIRDKDNLYIGKIVK